MAFLPAWRNLSHDRSRFLVTMVGVTFSVVLIALDLGLFYGFSESTTSIIRGSRADLWVMAKGTRNFEIAVPISNRELYTAKSVPGVAHAEGLIVRFAPWAKPTGGFESVFLVGFDLNSGLSGPASLVQGRLESLRLPDAVVVDRLYIDKLGVEGVGETLETRYRRTRLVGLTEGIRSFATSPWVFTSARTARRMLDYQDSEWNYVLVELTPGTDPDRVRDALRAAMPRADVYRSDEFAEMTHRYWTYTTGAGAPILACSRR